MQACPAPHLLKAAAAAARPPRARCSLPALLPGRGGQAGRPHPEPGGGHHEAAGLRLRAQAAAAGWSSRPPQAGARLHVHVEPREPELCIGCVDFWPLIVCRMREPGCIAAQVRERGRMWEIKGRSSRRSVPRLQERRTAHWRDTLVAIQAVRNLEVRLLGKLAFETCRGLWQEGPRSSSYLPFSSSFVQHILAAGPLSTVPACSRPSSKAAETPAACRARCCRSSPPPPAGCIPCSRCRPATRLDLGRERIDLAVDTMARECRVTGALNLQQLCAGGSFNPPSAASLPDLSLAAPTRCPPAAKKDKRRCVGGSAVPPRALPCTCATRSTGAHQAHLTGFLCLQR